VNFDWDDCKEAENIKKHGVDFWEAQTVFSNPLAQQYADSHPSEDRFIIIGESAKERTLLVVFAEKKKDEIRIISARTPTAKEKEQYEEGI
jgi:uncharacterized DUF497 family protein